MAHRWADQTRNFNFSVLDEIYPVAAVALFENLAARAELVLGGQGAKLLQVLRGKRVQKLAVFEPDNNATLDECSGVEQVLRAPNLTHVAAKTSLVPVGWWS